jgi:hypothetical protein
MSKRAASQELDHDPVMAKKFAHLKVTSDNDIVPAHDFALSILENRKLAQYVRHVSLNYNHWAPFLVQALSYKVTTGAELENEARFKAAIAEQKWEEAEATELLRRLITPSFPRSSTTPALISYFLMPLWHFFCQSYQMFRDGQSVTLISLHMSERPYKEQKMASLAPSRSPILSFLPMLSTAMQPGQTTAFQLLRSSRICFPWKASVERELEVLGLRMPEVITTYPARHLLYVRFI